MHQQAVRGCKLRRWFRVLVAVLITVGWTTAACAGPDVMVMSLFETSNFGSSNGIRGYALGTTACNIGDAPMNWCNSAVGCGLGTGASDHPVIAQNMYRLKNGRMDQIGASWLKHGFASANAPAAGCGSGICTQPPLDSAQLGVGCIDPYGSGLNGGRPMGRRSEVNASTGAFPFPYGLGGDETEVWNQRLAVAENDLSAAANPGARYFIEGQYVAPDEALAGNALNNASYQEVSINAFSFNLTLLASTTSQKSAIEAWKLLDPSVELLNVDVPSQPVQRFQIARKVTTLTPGALWHYEYAVRNFNSDRAADRLSIRFFGNTTISGAGFHDVNAHSGEPYDSSDWPSVLAADGIDWQAPAFPSAPANANAIRWGTLYNFWFDASRPPADISSQTLHLFTAGTPSELGFGVPVLFADGFEG